MLCFHPSTGAGRLIREEVATRESKCRVARVKATRGRTKLRCCAETSDDGVEKPSLVFVSSAETIVTNEDDRRKLWAEIDALEKYREHLVASEKYLQAAEIRDEIRALKGRDLYEVLHEELREAVKEERYLDAARIQGELKLVPAPPTADVAEGQPVLGSFPPMNPSPRSERVSEGVRVKVKSFLLEEASFPSENMFVFGYKVKITNESYRLVQLVGRKWRIRTESGTVAEIETSGVIGKQPVLEPNETFSYTSMCPLTAPEESGSGRVLGSMSGTYDCVAGKAGDETFKAQVDEFYHILP